MLKQEKSRAAAAEASLHGTSKSSNTHPQTASTKEQTTVASTNGPHLYDHHSQNSSTESDRLPEQQRNHKASHKGLSINLIHQL